MGLSISAAKLMVEVGADTRDAEQKVDGFGKKLNNTAKSLGMTGAALTAGVTLPIAAAGKSVFDLGVGFESAFAGVIKTVDGTESEISGLRSGILAMANDIPASAESIAGVAEAAGQLGIETGNILEFSEVMSNLGVATNMGAEEAAMSLARMANITQMSQDDFGRLGSTIVELGNNLATTESEIVEMSLRIAGAGSQIGLTEAQILAFGGALSSVGIEAQAGGSAISRVMIDIANSVEQGDDKLALFAETAGMSVSQFQTAFEDDAAGAILSFIEGLGQMSDAGENVFGVLDELELSEIRVRDALLRASGAGDLFRESLAMSGKAWEENIALTKEAETRYGTMESQMQLLTNKIVGIGIAFYDRLRPAMGPVLDQMISLVDQAAIAFSNMSPQMLNAALAFTAVLAAAGPVLGILAAVMAALAFLITPLGAVIAASALLAAAWAADFGGIQEITRTAASNISTWLGEMQTELEGVASGIETAFSNTTFPTVEELWNDFKGGNFQSIANTIRDTAFELMVNLDTEFSITAKANELRDKLTGVVQSALNAINNFDFGGVTTGLSAVRSSLRSSLATAFSGIDFSAEEGVLKSRMERVTSSVSQSLSALTTTLGTFDPSTALTNFGRQANTLRDNLIAKLSSSIAGVDWEGVGTRVTDAITGLSTAISNIDLSFIDWATFLKGKVLGPLKPAMDAIEWVIDSRSFTGLLTSVQDAIGAIQWAGIGEALGDLSLSIIEAADAVFLDMVSDVTTAINEIDWSTMSLDFAELLNNITTAVNDIDWVTVGEDLASDINDFVTNAFSALSDIAAGEEDILAGFKTAVTDALSSIEWGEIGTALVALETSLKAAFAELVLGAMTEIATNVEEFAFEKPPWLEDLTTWEVEEPAWVDGLTTWTAEKAAWIDTLTTWTPDKAAWIDTLTTWVAEKASWIDTLTTWTAEKPGWVDTLTTWIADKADWIDTLTTWLPEEADWVTTLTAWLPEKADWVDTLTTWIAEKPGWIDTLTTWVAEKAGWIDTLTTWTPDKAAWVDTLTTWVADKAGWVDTLTTWTAEKPGWVDTLTTWVAEKAGWIDTLTTWVADEADWVDDLTTWVAEKADWVDTLTTWIAEEAEWVGTLTTWIAALPPWVTTLTTWVADLPDWVTTLTTWVADLPPWVTTLTTWIPSTPSWVTSLTTWSPSMPAWVSNLLNWSPSIELPEMPDWLGGGAADPAANATGTASFRGGLTWVGERGPELVALPRGSRIHSNRDSMAMAGAGGPQVIIENVHVADDIDIHSLTDKIARELGKRRR